MKQEHRHSLREQWMAVIARHVDSPGEDAAKTRSDVAVVPGEISSRPRVGSIGFDFGSVYTKAIRIGPDGEVQSALYRKKDGDDLAALEEFVAEAGRRLPQIRFRVGVTGIEAARLPHGRVHLANGILAIARGVRQDFPETRSIIEIGGHTAKFIVLDPASEAGDVRDFATNDACAAGTGSFLEQQARRLRLSVTELADLSLTADGPAAIAGRCTVFAKSDMIHLQQKGTPLEQIAYGLCVAIARNAMATLLKGRGAEPPVTIAGGCARNQGILRAFAGVLGVAEPGGIVPSRFPGLEGALGAALAAREASGPTLTPSMIRRFLRGLLADPPLRTAGFAALRPPSFRERLEEPAAVLAGPAEGYLGVDIGSVSTDFVVLDAGGEPLTAIYLPTRGRPVDALLDGLALLAERFPAGLRVLGCGATGSARYLAAGLLGADVVKNEITCQMLGARRYVPDVDTVFEIGGQDSKFIAIRNGVIHDFAMNKICSAGTGSFLEEQSSELGIDIVGEFSARALASRSPLDLGARCTVFMETEVVNALTAGVPVEDVCAGLAYAIARNYLEKVVGNRPLGNRIVFQGGVASNDAVVAAFEQVLGQPVHVHPLGRISGAVGAALAAREATGGQTTSRFQGLEAGTRPVLRSFECHHCSNRCEVNVIELGGRRAFYGDTCERYTSGGGIRTDVPVPNLAEEYLRRCEACFRLDGQSGRRIGIPRASVLMDRLPFWATFFKALGHRPVLSESTSAETLAGGVRHLAVGVCLPVKLAAGHAHSLAEAGVDDVFLPAVVVLPGDDPAHSHACPYTMAVPFMVDLRRPDHFLTPIISFVDEDAFVEGFDGFRERLGTTRAALREAYREAAHTQAMFDEVFRRQVARLVEQGDYRYCFAVLGKPYNTFDGFMNLNLFERLSRMGVLAVPMKYLPVRTNGSPSDLPWRYSADMHNAARALTAGNGIHPVVISNFSCGPDAFAFPQIEGLLDDRPHLILEFDEHRGEAGLITRLEAFLDQLDQARTPDRPAAAAGEAAADSRSIPAEPAEVYVPYFADHAYAFSGLWKIRGHNVTVLPPPDSRIRALGEEHSLGKECHAFSMIAGDLLNLDRIRDGRHVVFYVPGTNIPCLLHEYGPGMQRLLQKVGIEGIRVSMPTGTELFETFGLEGLERLYLGILAIELLVKAVCAIRPYEIERGRTDRIHQDNLERIEAAVARGDVLEALDEALSRLAAIPVARSRPRPVVGIAGDIYTRVNPSVNDDLFRWLEDQGLEVWPSPFQIDLLDFGISRRFYQSMARLQLADLLKTGGIALRRELHHWRVRRMVGERIPHPEEPGYLDMQKMAAPYMPIEAHELLFLNVARIVDFARCGADGVINAICFNCMVGNASAAIIEKIRRDYHGVPIITAVYAGGEDPSRRMVLEAFVSQVKAHHRRRTSEPE